MLRSSGAAARAGEMGCLALPLPPELPAGLAQRPRVIRLVDLDSVSHGLARGAALGRASNQDVQRFLDVVQATAGALDPHSRVRCAASTTTAAYHRDLLTASGNNQWCIRRGLNGADQVLLDELNDLADARMDTTKPGRKRRPRHADLVILGGQDHIYARLVRRLRLLGIPTWLVVPGRQVAASLYSSSCAVSYLPAEPAGPRIPAGRPARPARPLVTIPEGGHDEA